MILAKPTLQGSIEKLIAQVHKKCLTFHCPDAIVALVNSTARALSSVGERFVHTEEATGSSPVAPIHTLPQHLDFPYYKQYTIKNPS